MPKLLEIQDLKTYFFTHDGIVKAVDGISYELAEGETLGIVGESGCGKSVSALSIMGLVASPPGRIVDGSITFEGEDLVNMDIKRLRDIRGNRISMVFQEPMTSLNPVLTEERQLTASLALHQAMRKDDAREAERVLPREGLVARHEGAQERQRARDEARERHGPERDREEPDRARRPLQGTADGRRRRHVHPKMQEAAVEERRRDDAVELAVRAGRRADREAARRRRVVTGTRRLASSWAAALEWLRKAL